MTVLGMSIILVATALGSAMVFLFRNQVSDKVNTAFLGFSSGVMIAASIWSLILPSLEGAEGYGGIMRFLPTASGFLIGGLFLVVIDYVVPHFHKGTNAEEGPHSRLQKSTKMFLAVTIHNIPEGLAVGFAFGAAATLGEYSGYISALTLAIGMAIQNLPEGAAVALPMRESTGSRGKAFLYGASSGIAEPVAAIAGYFFASMLTVLQPWLLAFAAGTMIFVVAEDLIPDAHLSTHPHVGTWGVMLGFVVMMILDIAFG